MTFKGLHNQEKPLLLFNVWDVASLKLAEKLGFAAVGTSSAAIASMLGYEDGEKMTFWELEYIVKRIIANTQLPVSVDLEAGYSRDPDQIIQNIKTLAKLGIKGINIEDSIVNGNRVLTDIKSFSELIKLTKESLNRDGIDLFINVRTDTFLLDINDAVDETLKRIESYEAAGADGIFTPGLVIMENIERIVDCTELPINVMCMPDLPDFDVLSSLGLKRISMGNFMFNYMYSDLKSFTQKLMATKSFKPLF